MNRISGLGSVILLSLLLVGCTNKQAINDYNQIHSRGGALTLDQAIESGSSRSLSAGRKTKSELLKSDALLKNGSKVGNFHLYEFSPPDSGEYLFNVKALCGCLGLNRSLFKPAIHVFNRDKEEISPADLRYALKGATFSLPLRNEATWTLNLEKGQKIMVLIAADNSNVGEVVMSDLIHQIVLGPTGKYHFSVDRFAKET